MIEPMTVITEFVNATLNLYLIYFFFSCFYKKKSCTAFTFIIFLAADVILTCSLLLLKGNIIIYVPMFTTTMMIALPFECKMRHKGIYSVIILCIMGSIEMITAIILTNAFSIGFEEGKSGVLYIVGMLLSKFVVFLIVLIIPMKKALPSYKAF